LLHAFLVVAEAGKVSEAARRLLNRALARDPEAASKLTMAARKGKTGELSDDEVRSLLEDFDELGALPTPDEPDGEV